MSIFSRKSLGVTPAVLVEKGKVSVIDGAGNVFRRPQRGSAHVDCVNIPVVVFRDDDIETEVDPLANIDEANDYFDLLAQRDMRPFRLVGLRRINAISAAVKRHWNMYDYGEGVVTYTLPMVHIENGEVSVVAGAGHVFRQTVKGSSHVDCVNIPIVRFHHNRFHAEVRPSDDVYDAKDYFKLLKEFDMCSFGLGDRRRIESISAAVKRHWDMYDYGEVA